MSNRIYDSSQLTKRRAERAIAGSFITRISPPIPGPSPQTGYGPLPGIYDSSVMNAVKTGNMTEFTRYPTCVGISPGCPCPQLNASVSIPPYVPAIPGAVSGITFTVGSIVVSWNAPTTGDGPFTYLVTPYLNGIALTPVTTSELSYRFTGLEDWQPYTFTVCAMNGGGLGPVIPSSSYFLAPPDSLSTIMNGGTVADITPALKYVINAGLDTLLQYVAAVNLGPTRGSRFIYVWITSVVGAWNWIRSESRISGTHDNWNWDAKASSPLSDDDSIIWLTCVIDYVTPFFVPTYTSIYNCPADIVSRVRTAGQWTTWQSNWRTWYDYRQADGYVAASTTQPTSSANWNKTLIVDGVTVNDISTFPQPEQWTRLTVEGKKQGYLTYNWDSVLSSCLTEADEVSIQNTVQPVTGILRDTEIDLVMNEAANLSDEEKIIAEFWAGGPGTVSPPLMFIWLWKEYIRTVTISAVNIIFSLEDLAIHLFEGGRITWRLKAAWMQDRPIQEVRRRYTGQQVVSWNGTIDGSQWVPYQMPNFVTPPFADFPSGHSHFSKAFALTMNKWFGNSIIKNNTYYDKQTLISPIFKANATATYGDFLVEAGKSEIQPGITPDAPVTLSFVSWNDMADQAGLSRLYGGIHAYSAHSASQTTAVEVDTYINNTWNIQTN